MLVKASCKCGKVTRTVFVRRIFKKEIKELVKKTSLELSESCPRCLLIQERNRARSAADEMKFLALSESVRNVSNRGVRDEVQGKAG